MKNARAFCQALKQILEEEEVIQKLEEASQEIMENDEERRAYDLERVMVQRTPQANLKENKKEILENIDRAQMQALSQIPFHTVSKKG